MRTPPLRPDHDLWGAAQVLSVSAPTSETPDRDSSGLSRFMIEPVRLQVHNSTT